MAMLQPVSRHPFLALVLPVLLIGVGLWELKSLASPTAFYSEQVAHLQASIDHITPLVASDPDHIVTFTDDPQHEYHASEALELMRQTQTELRHDLWVDEGRLVAAWMTAICGAIAFVAVLFCLLVTTLGARSGLRSRDALVRGFSRVVRLLPPLLGCIALTTALSVLGAVLALAGGVWFLQTVDAGEIKLIFIALALAVCALLYAFSAVLQLRRGLNAFIPQPLDVLGRTVDAAEAPGLWAFLRDIAERQGAQVPDHIVLGLTEGFFVTSSAVRLAPSGQVLTGRTLYLWASVLPLLRRSEVAAIIAHELAHFTGEDTRYSLDFLPLYASMSRSMTAVAGSGEAQVGPWLRSITVPAATLARHVLDRFHRVVRHWSQRREFEADRASLAVVSGRDTATALLRSSMGSEIVNAALRQVYDRPSRSSEDFVGEVMSRAATVGFGSGAPHLEDEQPHPTDTHPPTRQRITALDVAIDDALLAEAGRSLQPEEVSYVEGWFANWVGLRRQLGTDLLGVAHEQDQRFQAELQEAASAIPTKLAFSEGGLMRTWVVCLMGVMLIGVSGIAVWLVQNPQMIHGDNDPTGLAIIGAAMFAIGAACLGLGIAALRRRRQGPFLTLDASGLTCAGIADPIPWSAIGGFRVMTGRIFITTIILRPDAALPRKSGWRWSVRVKRRRREIHLCGYIPRGIKPQPYLDTLLQAWRGFQAQQLLNLRQSEEAALAAEARAGRPAA